MARQALAEIDVVIRALSAIGVLQFVAMLLLLAKTKIIAVMLGPADVGTMSVIDKLVALISQVMSMSLPFAALRFLPQAAQESPARMELVYRQMRAVLIALVVPAALLGILIVANRPETFGDALLAHRSTLIVALLGLPVVSLVPFLTNAFAGALRHERAMYFSIAHAGSMVLAAAAAAFLGLTAFYGVYAILGGAMVTVMLASRRVLGDTSRNGALPAIRSSRELFRLSPQVWRFSAALLALTFAAPYAALFVQYRTMDLYGAAASGILQAAIGVSLSVRTLLGAAHAVFLTPQINREEEAAARMRRADEFQRASILLFLVALPPVLMFSDVVVRLLYSSQFSSGAVFVALFVAAEVVTMLSGTYQSLIVAADRMLFHVVQNLVAQALLVGVAAFALPRFGLVAAGLAALVAAAFMFASTLLFIRRKLGFRVSPEAGQMVMLGLLVVAVGGAIGSAYQGLTPSLLATKVVACVLIWLTAYRAMPAADRARLLEVANRLCMLAKGRALRRQGPG